MLDFKKRFCGIILVLIMFCFVAYHPISKTEKIVCNNKQCEHVEDTIINYTVLEHPTFSENTEEIRNEILYGELEEVAILVQAEAGNQDELGKRYVADVIFNRADSSDFPEYTYDVIYQMDPVQFATTVDGAMGKAGYTITEDVFTLVLDEYLNRTNSEIVYFRTGKYHECGTPAFKHGDHYFSTK